MFERALMDDDMICEEHLKDDLEVVVTTPGEYDSDTGEYAEPTEEVTWSGKGSVQPYVRASMTAIQEPLGGISLAVDAYKILLPPGALQRGQGGFQIRSGTRYFEPKHDALDPGGQDDYLVVIAAEVNR